jgi:heat shock protein HslJ
MKKLLFTTVLILSVVMLACGNAGKNKQVQKSDNLYNQHWVLKKINGKEVVKVQGVAEPSIEFLLKGNGLSANTGCNDVSGKAVISGDEIKFSEMSMTKMMCMDAIYEIEFAQILFSSEPLKYKIDNGDLTIFKEGIGTMTLSKQVN